MLGNYEIELRKFQRESLLITSMEVGRGFEENYIIERADGTHPRFPPLSQQF